MSEDYVAGIDLAELPCSCGGRMRLEKQNEVK